MRRKRWRGTYQGDQVETMSNLKRINEYKRILQKLLNEEGLGGVKLSGHGGSSISIGVSARMDIRFFFDGQKVLVINFETEARQEFNLADPSSLDAIKKIIKDDVRHMLNGKPKC
jgi:hypothetical protein